MLRPLCFCVHVALNLNFVLSFAFQKLIEDLMESAPISSNTHHNPNAIAAAYETARDVVTLVVPKVIAATTAAMTYTVQFLADKARNFSPLLAKSHQYPEEPLKLDWQKVEHTDLKVAAVYKDHDGNSVKIVGEPI